MTATQRITRKTPRYRCAECGKRYTLSGAQRAMANGCSAGCSGLDVLPESEARS